MSRFIARDEPVLIWTGKALLDARATIPRPSEGIILMAGLGGTFHHERVRAMARHFNEEGFATLVADLLTADEQQFDARTGHFRLDLTLLSERIRDAVAWISTNELTHDLPIGIFGTTEVAASAIVAAQDMPLFAVVVANPRLEQIRDRIARVKVPALILIDDSSAWDRLAMCEIPESMQVEPSPGVSALLDDDFAADVAARDAGEWFRRNLPALVAG